VAGLITVGGLATGLDTNKIIEQLLKVERRPLDLLDQEVTAIEATKASVATVGSKLAALRTAAGALTTVDDVLVRKASSSDEQVLTAAAGAGAARGSLTITVSRLASGSAAGATVGVSSTTKTIAIGAGTFEFHVGTSAVHQTVSVDASTTLEQLADAINDLGAGVTASTVNVGTAASPDYRLQIVSQATGEASRITIDHDDTTLAVQTTQQGQDAQFTLSAFPTTTFSRATNSFSDVLAGVTIALKSEGTATVTVDDDPDKIVAQVQTVVTAFNDLVTFVAGESTVEESKDKEDVKTGSLATDTTVRRLVGRLHELLSDAFAGAAGKYVNLSSLGITTQRDGTLKLDETKLRAAIGDDPQGVAEVFGGDGTSAGIADRVSAAIDQATGAGGALATHTSALDERLRSLHDQIDDGERRLAAVELDLRRQFAALESLVSTLQSQSSFLQGIFSGA
jgi:flagellar hook-associated protein 2